jgi:hypothetical protein
MLSVTVNLCSWLMLVGRFLMLRTTIASAPSNPSGEPSKGSEKPTVLQQQHRQDELVNLLGKQVEGVHRHLVECKWPVICTSCFFMTMFSWEIVGDEMGWLDAIWVPVLGVVILVIVVVWDNLLVRGKIGRSGITFDVADPNNTLALLPWFGCEGGVQSPLFSRNGCELSSTPNPLELLEVATK